MKKTLIIFLALFFLACTANAQWNNNQSPLYPDGHGGYSLQAPLTTDGLTVGSTTQKTYIDPTTGLTTYAVNSGVPLVDVNVEKTVLYFNVVNGSGVTLPGVYMAVEITNATNARTGMTLYGTNINGVAIPLFSTFGTLWANPVTGASLYQTGTSIFMKQGDGTTYSVHLIKQ